VTVVEFDPDAYARAQGEEPPPDVARPARRIYRLSELANLKSAAEDAVIAGGIMTRGGKVMVHAGSGVGKTTLLDHMLAALASGCPFLGRFRVDRPRRVLGIQGELAESELASHGQALLATFDGTPAAEGLTFWLETQLRLPSGYAELRAVVRDVGAEIVAIDPFLEFFEGESSDKPEQVGKLFAALDQLMRDEPTVEGIVVSHHSNVTQQRTAGSWKFEGWPSTILRLEKVPGTTHRKLTFEKIRAPSSTLDGHEVRIALGEQGYLLVEAEEGPTTAGSILAVAIVREAGGQLHRKALLDRLQGRTNCKLRAANKYLGDAVQGRLLVTVRDGNSALYQLAPKDAP
jgi:KaiC/GvpD/RAD55 family RecA-like ATPase